MKKEQVDVTRKCAECGGAVYLFGPEHVCERPVSPATTAFKARACECGTTQYAAQIKTIRVPGTFSKVIYVYFCLNGCHREGVGITEEQAAQEWNKTFPDSAEAYASSQSEKLVGIGQEAAEKMKIQQSCKVTMQGGKNHCQHCWVAAIIDTLVAERLAK